MREEWCPETESNRRHGDFQSPALPTELPGQCAADLLRRPRIKPAEKAEVKADSQHLPSWSRLGLILRLPHRNDGQTLTPHKWPEAVQG